MATTSFSGKGMAAQRPEMDDAQLLRRIREGDHAAFAALVRRHAERFYRLAYRFTGQRAQAEDIVQEAFIKLWENPQQWDPAKNTAFTTWFSRVIIHRGIDHQRKRRLLPIEAAAHVVDTVIAQDVQQMQRQRADWLEQQIAALPDRQRTALNLCFYQDVSNELAAAIMGVSLKSLQSLVMRAKAALKANIERKGEDHGY